jgi:hypothetical protein
LHIESHEISIHCGLSLVKTVLFGRRECPKLIISHQRGILSQLLVVAPHLLRILWFEAAFCISSLVSKKVSVAEKANMAKKLLEQPTDQLKTGPPVMPPLTPESTLTSRIGPQSWHFLKRLDLDTTFLSKALDTWEDDTSCQKLSKVNSMIRGR